MVAPSVTSLVRQGLRYFFGEQGDENFSGGLNLRDAASELQANESPDMYNVTLDERGGVAKRLGYAKWNNTPFNASLVSHAFYWPSGQNLITQSGTGLYKDTSTTAFKTFTTSDRCDLADFTGKLYIIHPVDGLFSYDGATVTAIVAGPKGSTLEPWQNKLWASADPNAKARVYFTGAGDGTRWYQADTTTTSSVTLPVATIPVADTSRGFTANGSINVGGQTVSYAGLTATSFTGCSGGSGTIASGSLVFQGAQNFNDIREKDSEPVVCLSGAAGLDVAGRPGLLAFKRRSTYRIYDSSNGSYQTIDPQVGAASGLAVTNLFERTLAVSEQGIFWTDGVGPLRPASDKLAPLFSSSQLNFSSLDSWCAGAKGDRCYFSLRRNASSANDLMLEYHPIQGWITANSNAATCYTTYGKDDQQLLSGSPSVNGQVYQQLKTGADDGAMITSRYQTRHIQFTAGHQFRILRLRVTGRGSFSVNPIYDYALSPATALSVNLSSTAGVYDTSVYDAGALYGPTQYEGFQDFQQLGVCRAISLQITESGSSSSNGLPILGAAAGPEVGGWGLYGLDFQYVPLGLS
jgi:hypothetical protein